MNFLKFDRPPCRLFHTILFLLACAACGISRAADGDALPFEYSCAPSAQSDSGLSLAPVRQDIWDDDAGGFRKGTHEFGLALAGGFGMRRLVSSHQSHDLALASVQYGRVMSGVVERNHWYAGNWELLGELFGGAQFSPRPAALGGLKGVLRYDFATGTKWVPFVDLGLGVLATDIHRPDLSSVYQFITQFGPGVHYFWRKDSAVTFQYRYTHISNAGLDEPNDGVNTSMFYLGMTWFF